MCNSTDNTTTDWFITLLQEYYTSKNIPYPKTTIEYNRDHPAGYSNSTLSTRYKIKLRPILDTINNVPVKIEPKSIEEAIQCAKTWLTSTSNKLPNTQRAWQSLTVESGLVPFSASYAAKYNFSLLEVINSINGGGRKVPTKVDIAEIAKLVNVTLLSYDSNKVTYTCNTCNSIETVSRVSLRYRAAKGLVGCYGMCNTLPGKPKSIEFYQQFMDKTTFTALKIENQNCIIKHEPCGNLISRGIRYIVRKDRDDLVCEHCGHSAIRSNGFSSKKEMEIINFLVSRFPQLILEREVQYSSIVPTNRKFRADVYYKELNLVLEITTKDNKFEGYLDNLKDKLHLLHSNNIIAYKVTSIKEVEDIVSSLLKDKEV